MKHKFTTEITAEAILLCNMLIAHKIAFKFYVNVTDNAYVVELDNDHYLGTFRRFCGSVTACNLII